MTNNSSAIGALNEIGISINDANGNLKPTGQIIEEIASKWSDLSDAEKQNTAVKSAGIYQLSRFNALMNNFSIAQSAADTSVNSFGSALQEQEAYSESLQARINRLSNAFTTLAVSAGDALISDSLIVFTEDLGNFLQSSAKVVDVIGFLPIVLGTAGLATALFSKNVRGMATALITGNVSLSGTAASLFGLQTGMTRAAIATAVFKTALRGLLISSGVGVALAALGFVVEKLTNAYAEAKQKQQEFEEIQNTTIQSLTESKQSTQELLDKYQELTKAKQEGSFSSEDEQEYLQVQQQLATLLPTMVDHYDSQGNAILKTGDALKAEIEYTKELVRQKKELQQIEAQSTIQNAMDEANNLQDDIDSTTQKLNRTSGISNANITDADRKQLEIDITELNRQYQEKQMQIREELQKTVDSYFTDITIDTSIAAKVNDVINTLEVSDASAEQLNTFSKNVSSAMKNMQNAVEENDPAAYREAQDNLDGLLSTFRDVDGNVPNLSLNFNDVKNSMDGLTDTVEGQKVIWDEYGDTVAGVTDTQEEQISSAERLAGVTQSNIDAVFEMIGTYQALNGVQGLNETQTQMLTEATENLKSIYPGLVKNGQLQIDKMYQQISTKESLLKATEKLMNGELTSDEATTVSKTLSTNSKIDAITAELQAMSILGSGSADIAEMIANNEMAATDAVIAEVNQRIKAYEDEFNAMARRPKLDADGNIIVDYAIGLKALDLSDLYAQRSNLTELQGLQKEADNYAAQIAEIADYTPRNAPDPEKEDSSSGKSDAEKAAEEASKQKEEFLNDVTELYKDAYEKQRDIALDAIAKEREAFEAAHESKMDKLDEELDKYTEIIDSMKESIDLQESEDDYNKQLTEAQQERQKLVDELNKVSLDNSFAGLKRQAELKEQIADADENIAEMQHDRQIELQKQNLDNLLEAKQTEIENSKAVEEATYDAGIAKLDAKEESTERKYDNLINDQRALAKVQDSISSGSTSSVLTQLSNFINSISSNKSIIGESVAQNVIDALNEAKGKISSKNFTPLEKFDTGGYTGSSEGLAYLHSKEIVLNADDTSNMLEAVKTTRSFADVMGNLDMGKLLTNTLSTLTNIIQPSIHALSPSTSTVNSPTYSLNIENINVTGDKKGADTVWQTIYKNLKTLG